MKKNFYSTLVLVLLASQIFSQCGARYKDMIFPSATITSDVIYSTANSTTLKLDVYQPTGDTTTMRPLIILAHGGSFISGDKLSDGTVTRLCTNFAKRGYVTASIDYRLCPQDFISLAKMYSDSNFAIDVVLKALSDGKSAIRFFRKDAANANVYKINPSLIFGGGNSAGAVLYMHAIYVDSLGELTTSLQTIINANGGFEGNSGNDGYSSELQGLVNCAGGLNIPEFVGPGNKPSVNFQGDQDGTVPYTCGLAQGGQVKVRLCGLGVIDPLYQQYGINHVTHIFPGDAHCPWDGSTAKFALVDTVAANFLYSLICTGTVGLNDVTADAGVSVFPNPANNELHVFFSQNGVYSKVQLMDETGRLVEEKNVNASTLTFSRNNLSSGLYVVRLIKSDATSITKKVVFN